ncbi:MAG: HAMP domain-containing sensor histidine kinase [Bacteroidales bacterium]|nr:HAMP domain-containing sensor histidine kinase [Bacteroidales bacterium]MDP3001860.1 HAMP domain-containing sensor histidine kinase [Bacteroidales bacterium]
MIKLRLKLALFNLLSKLVFTALFILFMPYLIERINLIQIDNVLIQKREQVITLISKVGIEPFMTSDTGNVFGSYNILKEEFISLERIDLEEDVNYIEVTPRLIEGEEISYRILNYSFKVDGDMYLLEVGKSLASILDTEKNIRKVMLVFLVFIILITLLTDLQYNRLLLRPLDIITNKLKGISNPSIFDKTPVRTTTSDFYYLDRALRNMMEHIDELFQKEKEITVNISHELLTPVSVIRSKLENLLIRKDIDPEISIKIEESLKTLHRLQSLVNSLLLIARIESRQYLREESFSVKEVLLEIISEINPIAEDAGIFLKENISQDFQFKEANRPLIFSMFYNVINNAVKNTPSGGEVLVKSSRRENYFIVTITDTGKGITENQMSTLFSRFKNKMGTNSNGTGIGLAISKSIADFHGIDITVNSIIQKGTSFSFSFPKSS